MRMIALATAVAGTLTLTIGARAAYAADNGGWDDGPFQLRVRGVFFEPTASSDNFNLTTTGGATTSNDLKLAGKFYPEFDGELYFSDHWSTEVALPFATQMSIKLSGRQIGTEKLMPITWTAKYTFKEFDPWRPYVGAGIHITNFSYPTANIPAGYTAAGPISTDDTAYGFVLQGGVDWKISHSVFLNADLRYLTHVDPSVNSAAGIQSLKIDPLLISIGIGYRFGGSPAAAVAAAAPVLAAPPAPPPPPPPLPPAPPPTPVVDSDGDGVPDSLDQCPNTPRGSRVDAVGCPCDISQEVHFATGSAKLTPEDQVELDQVIVTLKQAHFKDGEIDGYTDSTGGKAMNEKLSERRARAVADYLAAHGLPETHVTTMGYGEADPVGDNKTKEGRAHNRRVVVHRTDCAR